jgi:hypothetical protein
VSESVSRQDYVAGLFYGEMPGASVSSKDIRELFANFVQRGLITIGPAVRSPADELWSSLELEDNDQVVDAVLIAKVADFERGGTAISIGATESCDWVTQLGILHAALQVMSDAGTEQKD